MKWNKPEIYTVCLSKHVVVLLNGFFYHYDGHDERLHKNPIDCVVGRHEEEIF